MLRLKAKPAFFIVPVVLALAAVGCGGGSKGGILVGTVPPSSGQASSGATATSGNSSGGANAQPTKAPSNSGGSSNSGGGNVSNAEILQLYNNFVKVKSYRLSADVGNGQKFQMEVVQPDRVHYVISGGTTGNIELISIGNDSYIKTGSTWTKAPGSGIGNALNVKDLSSQVQKASNSDKQFTKGGTDTVNGKKCQIYTDNTDGGTICIADGLPLKVTTKDGANSVTIIFSDYNANIDIKAPI